MRILVAEDTLESRELLIDLLRNGGHTVVGVANGREAIQAAEKEPFEVIFMDEQMPSMNGTDAARAIRQTAARHGKRPIIVGMSGNTAEADERRCLEAGMDAFLPKPIGMPELLGMLAVLSRRPPQPASPNRGQTRAELILQLQRTTGGDQKVLRTLVKNFLADAPKKITNIRRSLARRDAEAMASSAHALKGSLGLFGANRAVDAARNLQNIGRTGTVEGAGAEFHALEEEFGRLRRELRALFSAAKPKRRKTTPKPRARRAPKRSARRRR